MLGSGPCALRRQYVPSLKTQIVAVQVGGHSSVEVTKLHVEHRVVSRLCTCCDMEKTCCSVVWLVQKNIVVTPGTLICSRSIYTTRAEHSPVCLAALFTSLYQIQIP